MHVTTYAAYRYVVDLVPQEDEGWSSVQYYVKKGVKSSRLDDIDGNPILACFAVNSSATVYDNIICRLPVSIYAYLPRHCMQQIVVK